MFCQVCLGPHDEERHKEMKADILHQENRSDDLLDRMLDAEERERFQKENTVHGVTLNGKPILRDELPE